MSLAKAHSYDTQLNYNHIDLDLYFEYILGQQHTILLRL